MTQIECPSCKKQVDIDSPSVEKQEDGLDLIVRCPQCQQRFIVQRVALVRQQLRVAEFGYRVDETGQEIRISLQ